MAKAHKTIPSSGGRTSGGGSVAQAVSRAARQPQQQAQQQQASAQQQAAQQPTPQQTQTPANVTSSNVKAYFGNNNGGFKDVNDLIANQTKVEALMDSLPSGSIKAPDGHLRTPQWVLAEAMGYNAPPKVHDHLSTLPDQNDRIPIFRGTSSGGGKSGAQNAQEFKTGDNFAGEGIYGDGTYFQLSYSAAMNNYGTASKDSVITASINPKKMRIISFSEIQKQYSQLTNTKNLSKLSPRMRQLLIDNNITEKTGKVKQQRGHYDINGRLGTLATLLGYDAIYRPGGNGGKVPQNQPVNGGKPNDFFCILNRGCVDVKEGY